MRIFNFEVGEDDSATRIDVFLAEAMDMTRSSIQNLIQAGNVLVNSLPVSKNFKLKFCDLIEVRVPDPIEAPILAENILLDIAYEDSNLIVINKPRGMVVHPAPGHHSGTLVNALMYHCKDNLSGINGVMRPGIVHRIDKDTSGLIVAAKNDEAHQSLSLQLAEHSMIRVYNAIAFDNIKSDEGVLDFPIARSPYDRKKMAVVPNGRRAVTHYKVLERYNKKGSFNLLELKLETGRTHQIRVHLSHIGHPLLGDEVYSSRKQPFNSNGQILHAKVLGFSHPATGEQMLFCSELPEYFKSTIEKF